MRRETVGPPPPEPPTLMVRLMPVETATLPEQMSVMVPFLSCEGRPKESLQLIQVVVAKILIRSSTPDSRLTGTPPENIDSDTLADSTPCMLPDVEDHAPRTLQWLPLKSLGIIGGWWGAFDFQGRTAL